LSAESQQSGKKIPDIQAVERMALDHSLKLQNSRIQSAIAKNDESAAFREYFPALSVTYRQNRTVARRDFDNGRYSVQLNISQPIYDGGRTSLRNQIARVRSASLRDRRSLLEREVRFRARELYLSIQKSVEEIQIQEAAVQRSQDLLQKSRQEFKHGQQTRLDFLEIRNQNQQTRLQLESSIRSLFQKIQELCLLTGQRLSEFKGIRLLDLGRSVRASNDSIARKDLHARLRNHPEVLRLRRKLYRARQNYLIARQYYLPRISLTARYGKTGENWPPERSEWGFGINITFRGLNSTLSNNLGMNRSMDGNSSGVSSGGKLRLLNDMDRSNSILRSKKELLNARRKLQDLRKRLPVRMRRLLQQLDHQKRQLELQENSQEIRKRRFQVDSIRYDTGEISLEEYQEEELRFRRAETKLKRQQADLLQIIARAEKELVSARENSPLLDLRYLSTGQSNSIFRRYLQRDYPIRGAPGE
tara:strand:+ start:46140 stop:47564 length:1425 start_codon:yes stop_codon:yes gene_type:complete